MATWDPKRSIDLLLARLVARLCWWLAAAYGTLTVIRIFGGLATGMRPSSLVLLNAAMTATAIGSALLIRTNRHHPGMSEVGWSIAILGLALWNFVGLFLDGNPLRVASFFAILPLAGLFSPHLWIFRSLVALLLAFILGACFYLKPSPFLMGYLFASTLVCLVFAVFVHRIMATLLARVVTLLERLQASRAEVQELSGLLPLCAWCHKIRDDQGYWGKLDGYIESRTKAQFTHSACPECLAKLMEERTL